ncbi:MAG: DMT family transporter [Acidobacteria bacterium]|nr:DMT family transporter [Acidobacteriota bacterium]
MCEAPALVIAFYRVLGAVLILIPARILRPGREAERFSPAAALAGVLLGLHWGIWIRSVQVTTVASAVFLVSTQPVFAALLGRFLLGERVGRAAAGGIATAVGGVALIAGADGGGRLTGNLLAVFAAVLGAGYLLIGRRARTRMNFLPYLVQVYASAAASLGLLVAWFREPLYPYPPSTWFWIGMLAVFCSLLGHGTLNWAVRRMPAYLVNLAILLEPVLATLYALFLFGQRPGALLIPGAALVVGGLAAAFLDEGRRGREAFPPGAPP